MNMLEIEEKAAKYAVGKMNEVFDQAIAQAYADGYRDGYKDRGEEIPVDLRDDKTVYVDLGLPSGTLWSADYEKEDDDILFVPYLKVQEMNIPTEEQWNELLQNCKLQGNYSSSAITFGGITCIGPNGNSIKFHSDGYMRDTTRIGNINYGGGKVYFWIHDDDENPEHEKKVIYVNGGSKRIPNIEISHLFSGYKCPIRLVRTK